MFLSPAEMRDLTEARSHRKQIHWLIEHGYRFEVSTLGRPKVLVSAVEARLGHAGIVKRKEPNFEGLRDYGQKQKNAHAD